MLRVSPAVPVPSVIRNVHKDLRALIRKLPHVIRKYRLIANKNTQPLAPRFTRSPRRTPLKLSTFFRQPARKSEQLRERKVFSERDQMHFVITRSPLARWTHQPRRIENLRRRPATLRRRRAPNRTRHNPALR